MNPEVLIRTFPRLYHMAHVDAWPGIERHGLRSASALLDLFEITGARRHTLESCRRKDSEPLRHSMYGEALIRDNKPMDDAGLLRALTDMTPTEWYRTLNSKVFFWLTEARLTTLLKARAYRGKRHCVITVDTHALLQDYGDKVWLSPINSGATKPMPHPRGSHTFHRIADYAFDEWARKRGSPLKAVAELAVDYAVPNLRDYVPAVNIRDHTGIITTVFAR